jgi:hypothetical protein
VRIEYTGLKNPLASSARITLDGIDVVGEMRQAVP